MKKPRPIRVYGVLTPNGKINPYWVRSTAAQITDGPRWDYAKSVGNRIIRVEVRAIGKIKP